MNKSDELFLICGAAGGEQGAIGNKVTHILLNRGLKVRALVLKEDQRSESLRKAGAKIFVGDLLDYESVFMATKGVHHALFLYPVKDGLLTATANFVTAAKANHILTVVEIGHLHSRASSPSPRTRQHWLSEQLFAQANIGAIHLRCAIFYSNFLAFAAEMIPGKGALKLLTVLRGQPTLFFPAGFGDTLMPLVSAEDVALAAATILIAPEIHRNRTYLLAGEMVSFRQVKSSMEQYLGIKISYTAISPARFKAILRKKFPDNPLLVRHLSTLWSQILHEDAKNEMSLVLEQIKEGQLLSGTLENLTGRKPLSLLDNLVHHSYWLSQKNGK